MAESRWALVGAVVVGLGCGPARHRVSAPELPPVPAAAGTSAQARAAYLRGMVALEHQDLERARDELDRAALLDPASPYVLLARAEVAMAAEDLATAMQLWERALVLDPACAPAHERLGWAAWLAGDHVLALSHYRTAVELGAGWRARAMAVQLLAELGPREEAQAVLAAWPDVPEGRWSARWELLRRARLRLDLDDDLGAFRDLSVYLELRPDDPQALDLFLVATQAAGTFGQALDQLDALLAAAPSPELARRTYLLCHEVGDPWRSLSAIDALVELEGEDLELALDAAKIHMDLDQPRAAQARLDAVAHLAVEASAVRQSSWARGLAGALAAQGQTEAALEVLEVFGDPARIEVRLARAQTLRDAGRIDEARAVLDGLVAEHGTSPPVVHAMAGHLVRQGEIDTARDWLARSYGADAAELSYRLAVVLGAAGHDDEALAVVQAASERHGALDLLEARLLLRTGQHDQAAQAFAALAAVSEDARVWVLLGFARSEAGDDTGAEAAWERALQLDPRNATALNALAYTWAEQDRRLSEAERMLRRARDLNPSSGEVMDSLGWVLFKQGHLEDAIVELERARRYAPDDAVIADHLEQVRAAVGAAP